MRKILIDTNIFIYALDEKISFYKICTSLLNNSDYSFFTSSKNISEYFTVASNLKFEFGKVWKFYLEIRNNTNILFPNEKTLIDFEHLLKKYKPVGSRIYDFEIVSVMLSNNIHEIATINKKDFQHIKEISLFKF